MMRSGGVVFYVKMNHHLQMSPSKLKYTNTYKNQINVQNS